VEDNRAKNLIGLPQLAYSAERAAAYAYRGHWHSVVNADERSRIKQIEEEEWHHRKLVGGMLESLGAHPSRLREFRAIVIGRLLGMLCHVMGWLAPMYGAGRLESRNIREYETAAQYARACGREGFIDSLLTMAEVEWTVKNTFVRAFCFMYWAKDCRYGLNPCPKNRFGNYSRKNLTRHLKSWT